MEISEKGISIICNFEGFVACPYKDIANVNTIGYGTTFYEDGISVKMTDTCITHDRAIELLKHYLIGTESLISSLVTQTLNQNQFDSLCSFIYNVGDGAFKGSTLLKRINKDPNDKSIALAFEMWNKGKVNGKLVVIKDLDRRRREESQLYFS